MGQARSYIWLTLTQLSYFYSSHFPCGMVFLEYPIVIRLFCCSVIEMTLNLCILTSILNCQNQDGGEEEEAVIKQRLQGGVLVHGVWAGEAIRMVVTTE